MKRLQKGDRIRIISFPRLFDGADGFAGTVGTVEKISYEDKYTDNRVGHMILKMDDGSTFVSVGITRMKYEMVYEREDPSIWLDDNDLDPAGGRGLHSHI
jgi:hypothetical protein